MFLGVRCNLKLNDVRIALHDFMPTFIKVSQNLDIYLALDTVLDTYEYFVTQIEESLADISFEEQRIIKTGLLAEFLQLRDAGLRADMSSRSWRQFILWIRDLLNKGVTKINLVDFFYDRFGTEMKIIENPNPLDYMYRKVIDQHRLELVIEFDPSDPNSILLSRRDLDFLIDEMGNLINAHLLIFIVARIILSDSVDIVEEIDFAATKIVFDRMSFPLIMAPSSLSFGIELPYDWSDQPSEEVEYTETSQPYP